jgi:hypothetical protein
MYAQLGIAEPLSQGDILDGCPLFQLVVSQPVNLNAEPLQFPSRVLVLTQACDLLNAKSRRVVVAVVHDAASLVADGTLSAPLIRDRVRRGQVYGWYFLPAVHSPIAFAESIVDLRDLHTVDRAVLEHLVATNRRICRVVTPYREHLAQHFAVTYSRIGLPEPYETKA